MRAVVVGLEKKESVSETPSPGGERLDVRGQVSELTMGSSVGGAGMVGKP